MLDEADDSTRDDASSLRFHAGTALLLESEELIARLETLLEDTQQRAEGESRRAEEAEGEVARLREELSRLKK